MIGFGNIGTKSLPVNFIFIQQMVKPGSGKPGNAAGLFNGDTGGVVCHVPKQTAQRLAQTLVIIDNQDRSHTRFSLPRFQRDFRCAPTGFAGCWVLVAPLSAGFPLRSNWQDYFISISPQSRKGR